MAQLSQRIARGAAFLALALLAQSLRLFLPLPPLVGLFAIGSLVNASLLLAAVYTGRMTAALLGLLLPIVAFAQGQLPAPILIPAVAAGNIVFACAGSFFWRHRALYVTPFLKAGVLYTGVWVALRVVALEPNAAKAVSVLMSWPQIVTALCGVALARGLAKRAHLQRNGKARK